MALLGNYSVLLKNPGRNICGTNLAFFPSNYRQSGGNRGRFYGETPNRDANGVSVTETGSTPNGYRPPYTWALAPKEGGLSVYFGLNGQAAFTSSGGMAINRSSEMKGSGTISTAAPIPFGLLIASILGSGTMPSVSAIVVLSMAINMAGQGTISSIGLSFLGSILATLSGSGQLSSAQITALGNVLASIVIGEQGALTPGALADAVWDEVLSEHLTTGSTGKKLKDDLTQNNFIALQ